MITDRAAYERLCEQERWAQLQRLTVEESIALGEALLTSEMMDLATFTDDDSPASLAISLRLTVDRLNRTRASTSPQ